MEAELKRRIKSGKEFDHLFPPPTKNDIVVKKSAELADTIKLFRKALPQTLWQTEKIARVLKGRTLEETCSNVWHFVYEHIQYKRDEDGVEQVRSPRRAWWDRKTGVDCDCYTMFILSILRCLNINALARVTKYPKKFPLVPRWQHVYPIVPKPGHEEDYLEDRDFYIVIDCVKDDYNDEQPYLEAIDYDMRLDYLDGIEDEREQDDTIDFVEPDSVDLADLASIYDDEEMGNIFKKVGSAVKKVASNVKDSVKVVAKEVKQTAQKVGDKIGDGVRFLNRYLNPATILLRNGFLLAMKINLLNVAGRLRYAYMTDAQAQAKGINLNELKKLRAVKDRAETVYWQAGGKKENLKKGILSGKGNKDKKVPLSGFEGLDGQDNVYADYDEYRIIHGPDDLEGLGEIASGTAIAAATSAVAAIAAALKQVKGLFNKGGAEEQAFQSETDNAGTAATAPATIPEDEDAFTYDDAQTQSSSVVSKITSAITAPKTASIVQQAQSLVSKVAPQIATPKAPIQPAPKAPVQQATPQAQTSAQQKVTTQNEAKINSQPPSTAQSVLPTEYTADRNLPASTQNAETTTALQTQDTTPQKEGFFLKTTNWVKQNPGKTLLITGGIVAGGILIAKAMSGKSTNGLNGVPKSKRKRKKSKGKTRKQKSKSVKRQILL
jgi:hypothetical protein